MLRRCGVGWQMVERGGSPYPPRVRAPVRGGCGDPPRNSDGPAAGRIARRAARVGLVLVCLLVAATAYAAPAGKRPYRLPDTDLKQRVIWGAVCEGPDGTGLAFGGQDQEADDGRPHTRIKANGRWTCIRDDLRAATPLQEFGERAWSMRNLLKRSAASARAIWFKGLADQEHRERTSAGVAPIQASVRDDVADLVAILRQAQGGCAACAAEATAALRFLRPVQGRCATLAKSLLAGVAPDAIKAMDAVQMELGKAAEALDAEPPPRALSPIVHEPKAGLYVLFGGDHLDYLMNDTWVFDPTKRRWMQRHPPSAPPPRANHTLRATGDGKAVLAGGYTYSSNTDYCGGQYIDLDDGEWTYDVAADKWTGGEGVPPDSRTYRTGPFHPDWYLEGPKPDAAAHEKVLAALPVNKWVMLEPPRVPRLNRDWGTVRLDTDHDVILVWSGGHSAHGGTDVLHYHLSTNRWELPHPVEFPLGQLYANTRYPDGFNFNRRPWPTGHTYQNYEYDPLSKRLLFTGRPNYTYFYDPEAADWVGRAGKPPDMVYNSCFYTLTLCATPRGVICWGQGPRRERGRIHRYHPERKAWEAVELKGELPEPRVDHSTLVYDSKRGRLLLLCCDYGKKPNGQVWELDLRTMAARTLNPVNMAAAGGADYQIDRACYVPDADLVLLCTLLPGGEGDLRRHVAYDCERNRWVSLRINYETDARGPLAPTAVRRSVGLVYDARRKLIWGVDTNRVRVFVLRFDAKGAGIEVMK